MTKTKPTKPVSHLLSASAALAFAVTASAPAHAGLLDVLKTAVEQEVTETAEDMAGAALAGIASGVLGGSGTDTKDKTKAKDGSAKGKIDASWKVEEGEAVATAGLSQNGTTVPTADTVEAPQDEETALLLPAVQAAREAARKEAKLSQNGTTVATANEVQAPQQETRMWSRVANEYAGSSRSSERSKLSQNGTTVETADEIQAPRSERPARAKLSQNGTTVETASELEAPQSE